MAKRSEGGYVWQAGLEPARPPSSWRDASQDFFGAGIFRLGDQWVLFTDSIGAHPLYLREIGDTLFFATRLDPLLDVGGSLHINWEGWGHTFVIGAPLDRSTHFEEITRLPAATGRVLGAGAAKKEVSYEPTWLSEPTVPSRPEDIVDAVRQALPGSHFWARPPSITLSGGWDSRLLAALSREKYWRRQTAWTTDPDDGTDRDIEYASDVARHLQLPHIVVSPPTGTWPKWAAEARIRLQFETWLHPWLGQLSRVMRTREQEVVDGLAGDVLIKGLFVTETVLAAEPRNRLKKLFSSLAYRQRRDRLRGPVLDRAIEESRRSFDQTAERFHGHLNQLALTVLATRTAHPIALSPLTMFSPELHVWLPFMDPHVVSLTLSIDPQIKTKGRLYQEVLRHAAPLLSGVRSTNDAQPAMERRKLHQSSPESVAWMIETIERCETALDLIDPEFRRNLRQAIRPEGSDTMTARALQSLSLFAQWETANHKYLISNAHP